MNQNRESEGLIPEAGGMDQKTMIMIGVIVVLVLLLIGFVGYHFWSWDKYDCETVGDKHICTKGKED